MTTTTQQIEESGGPLRILHEHMMGLEISKDELVENTPPPEAECVDASKVEQRLHEIAELRDEWAGAERHATDQIDRANKWLEDEAERLSYEIKWRQASAMAWFKRDENNLGKPSRKLINGTLKKSTGRMRVIITDEESVPKDFCDHKPEKWTPNKNKIQAEIKKSGELPEGTDTEYGADEYYVDTGHGKDFRGVSVQYAEPNNDPDTDYELDETEGKSLLEWNGG